MIPISWTLMTKNCRRGIVRALDSLRPFLRRCDEVVVMDTGSVDGTQQAVEKALRKLREEIGIDFQFLERPDLRDASMLADMKAWKPKAFERYGDHAQFRDGCISDFAKAREITRTAATRPFVAWMDADDIIQGNPDALHKGFESFVARGGEAFFLTYDYEHDPRDGSVTTRLWRERIVCRERWHWAGVCHEVLIPNEGMDPSKIARSLDAAIIHHPEERKEHHFSDLRNYVILRRELERQGGPSSCDPRILLYLGNACRGLMDLHEAAHYYSQFIPRSGSPEDRVLAALYLGNIYVYTGRLLSGLRTYRLAEEVHPNDPRPHFAAQIVYSIIRDHVRAIREANRGLEKAQTFDTMNAVDPTKITTEPLIHLAESLRDLGKLDDALRVGQDAVRSRPGLEPLRQWFDELRADIEDKRACAAIANTLDRALDFDKRVQILRSVNVPEAGLEFGLARAECNINRDGRATVAILTGKTVEPWYPGMELTGVGGSERMVIEMAKRLQRRGLAVTVYANLPSLAYGGLRDGVLWRHFAEFNPLIERDYVVYWRSAKEIAHRTPVRFGRYSWLHDANPVEADPSIDRVIVLSPWHASCVKRGNVYLSRNGIDLDLIRSVEAEKPERKLHRFVYASSPERGLEILLQLWPVIKKICPEAELDVLYGFSKTYLESVPMSPFVVVNGRPRDRLEYMDWIMTLLQSLPGVRYHGRVGSREVVRTFFEANALLYPSTFTETFCIAAAEAQACGAVPIVFDLAALSTTVRHGIKVQPGDVNAYLEAVQRYLLDPPTEAARRTMMDDARSAFDLETLADEWVRDLFSEDLR